MSIRGSNFENQHPFASDHALVWERCIPDGLLYGVEMSFTPTLFTLGTGFMLVAGRMFEITAAESISISPGSGYARVYVAIDTGGAATENSFDQVSFGVDYAANLDSFAELTQGEININRGAAVYQAEVAVLEINSSGVTAIERKMELVSPGAGTGAFAAIAVTYPAGSTVTVTDGKITYTAPNTNGAALFIIPYAATWIVTATDGTNTKSESVEITSEGQSKSVSISYRLYLYKLGDEFTDITNGWNATLPEYTHKYDTYLYVSKNGNNDGTFGGYFSTGKAIDLTEYNNLCCYATLDRTHNRINGIVGIVSSATTGSFTNPYQRDAEAYTSSETEAQIIKADISGLTGMHYIHFVAGTPPWSYGCADEIWLE